MSKKIIINADDFGIHEAVNRGIIFGHSQGAISSTTIMPGGTSFDHAIALAASHPSLRVGVHLTLVGEYPVASPHKVVSLLDGEGRLPRLYPQFLRLLLQGAIRLTDVRCELEAQIRKVIATGVKPTHLDSHQHMHVVPGVIDIVLDLAKEFGIQALRIPDEPFFFFGGYPSTMGRFIGRGGLSTLARIARRKAKNRRMATTDHFYGMLAGGNMIEQHLLAIIDQLPVGVSEIMMHPGEDDTLMQQHYGWQYSWQAELAAVTGAQLKSRLKEKNIELISFRELGND